MDNAMTKQPSGKAKKAGTRVVRSAKAERLTARVPAEVLEMVRHAAELEGATVNQFLVQATVRAAKAVIEEHEVIRLSERGSSKFFELLNAEPAPVPPAFAAAAERYKKNNVHRDSEPKS